MPFTEANFENAILEIFRDLLSYEYLYGPDVVRDFAEPLCVEILEDALVRINPSLPRAAIDEAIARIRNIESGSLARKTPGSPTCSRTAWRSTTSTAKSSAPGWCGWWITTSRCATGSRSRTSGRSRSVRCEELTSSSSSTGCRWWSSS